MVVTSTRVYNRSESCNVIYERCRAVSRRTLTGKGWTRSKSLTGAALDWPDKLEHRIQVA